MIDQQQIEAGKRIEAFLADEVIKGLFLDLEKRYIGEFKTSTTSAERDAIHAKLSALQDLATGTRAIVDSGRLAQHKVEVQARQQRTPRR